MQIQSPDLSGIFRLLLAHTNRSNLLPSFSCYCIMSVDRNSSNTVSHRLPIPGVRKSGPTTSVSNSWFSEISTCFPIPALDLPLSLYHQAIPHRVCLHEGFILDLHYTVRMNISLTPNNYCTLDQNFISFQGSSTRRFSPIVIKCSVW